MVTVLQMTFWNAISEWKCLKFDSHISLKFVDNNWSLVQVMAWHLLGAMLLPEPVLTKIADAIWGPSQYKDIVSPV